ncbi:uncharacterized protein LOC124364111 isoform X2 [Homalodisca vitripennis]|uniref:uncharacterized protein LOC124364111 isoform X2 n=1 Tax=Homalodisca vitripennis TaxID=197043 RepID=UPI001EEBD274|nr:uncharacterized protein LOC124364111 isoform X2 [Homalodisca vitripennis]KAG8322335.1 hypothetical protein J6590_024680 [Homalodisca vitripennis]
MADNQFNIALSHGALAASSGWSLVQCMDLKFARIAFGLYLVNGVVGLVTYGNNSLRLYKMYTVVSQGTLLVVLPLIATQLYINQGFDYHLALFNLCFPVVHCLVLQLARLKHSRVPFLELLQCIPLFSIAYISLIHFRYYGLSVVISYTISFYLIGTTGMIYSTPAKDLFNISILFANYFTLNALRGF